MKMKLKIFHLMCSILLGLTVSCKREKGMDENGDANSQHVSPSVASGANLEGKQPSNPHLDSQPQNATFSEVEEWREWKERREAFRVRLFAIPLDLSAARDREEAWDKLAIPDNELRSSDEQLQAAIALLDRYANGTQIEKLVFWRLVGYRISSYYPGGIVRTLGEQGPSMTRDKMEETLYSALAANPETLPYDQALEEGLRILDRAVK
jgi:hypothetical protein